MTLKTVGYEFLRINIQNLKREYSNYLARYTIGMNEEEKEDARKNGFEITDNPLFILLARVNKHVCQCQTDRVSDCAVFPKLADEVRGFINGTPQEIKRATLYLLGGLIHRFLRIETEYNDYNKSRLNLYSWFSSRNLWNLNDCRLYNAVKSALALSEANKLDDYTIINALEVFQENMDMEVEVEELVGKEKKLVKKKRYETYEHFNTVDPNFKSNLEKMISLYKERGKSMVRNFAAIDFFQSLMEKLDQENQPVEREIKEWCASLAKTHKNFCALNREIIVQHLNQYYQSKPEKGIEKEHIQYLLEGILNNPSIIATGDYNIFLKELVTSNTDPSRSICCGAYILLMKQGNIDKKLATQMTDAFGFSEKLTIDIQVACLKAFKAYADAVAESSEVLASEGEAKLDYKFFGASKTMINQTTQLIVLLGEETAHSLVM